jgi:hypothetical protein
MSKYEAQFGQTEWICKQIGLFLQLHDYLSRVFETLKSYVAPKRFSYRGFL